jgi:hypothetical protein
LFVAGDYQHGLKELKRAAQGIIIEPKKLLSALRLIFLQQPLVAGLEHEQGQDSR